MIDRQKPPHCRSLHAVKQPWTRDPTQFSAVLRPISIYPFATLQIVLVS